MPALTSCAGKSYTSSAGTRLWNQLEARGGIAAGSFPEDWKYYTLTFPVARYNRFSCGDILREMETCDGTFYYSPRHIRRRVWGSLWQGRQPLMMLASNLSYRNNIRLSRQTCRDLESSRARVPTD